MRALIGSLIWLTLTAPQLVAQSIPAPRDYFGFEIGDDRRLADWEQLVGWYELIALTSPRVTLDTLGPTTLGHPFVMVTITSPENHHRLE